MVILTVKPGASHANQVMAVMPDEIRQNRAALSPLKGT